MIKSSVPVETGWFDKLKNTLQFDKISETFNLSKHKILDMLLFLGIGFLMGFLWKRFANYFIAALLFVGVLILLHQFDLISVHFNWIKLQECCGIEPAYEDADLFGMAWSWAKANMIIIFSFVIGFCFGAKVS